MEQTLIRENGIDSITTLTGLLWTLEAVAVAFIKPEKKKMRAQRAGRGCSVVGSR